VRIAPVVHNGFKRMHATPATEKNNSQPGKTLVTCSIWFDLLDLHDNINRKNTFIEIKV
jgi:hypothetical protein